MSARNRFFKVDSCVLDPSEQTHEKSMAYRRHWENTSVTGERPPRRIRGSALPSAPSTAVPESSIVLA